MPWWPTLFLKITLKIDTQTSTILKYPETWKNIELLNKMGNCLMIGNRAVFESPLKYNLRDIRAKYDVAKAKEDEELRKKKNKKSREVPARILPSRKCKKGGVYIEQTPVELPQPPKRNRTQKIRQNVSPSAPPAPVYEDEDPTSV